MATLPLDRAAGRTWDAVVVGAGPAGSATAARLAHAGWRTLLLDRSAMPRGKVCGCCLSTAAVAELSSLRALIDRTATGDPPDGLAAFLPTAVPLEQVCVAAGGRPARIPLPGGLVVSREALDARLVRLAIEAGCHWLPGCDVVAVEDDSSETGALTIVARVDRVSTDARGGCDGATLHGRHVVLATGLADHVRIASGGSPALPRGRVVAARSRIGLGTVLPATAAVVPPGELVMAVGREGYCGVVRLADGRLDVAAAVDAPALRAAGGPADVIRHILRNAFSHSGAAWLDEHALADAVVRATPPLSHRSPLTAGRAGRIFRVGDAAGYVEPFTGEGIGWGLAGARLLAGALVGGTRGVAVDPAAGYAAGHAAHFATRYARSGRVARGLRSPALVAGALGAALCAPWAARRVAPLLVGHATRIGLTRIGHGVSVVRPAREGVTPS